MLKGTKYAKKNKNAPVMLKSINNFKKIQKKLQKIVQF